MGIAEENKTQAVEKIEKACDASMSRGPVFKKGMPYFWGSFEID